MNERRAKWHQATSEDVCRQLHTDAACGLTRKAARSRFKKIGPNTLFDRQGEGVWGLLRPLLTDPALCLMLLATLLSFAFAGWAMGSICLLLWIVYAGVTAFFVRRQMLDLENISKYRIPTVQVIREGHVFSVSARHVVPGDLLVLHTGDIVPCDCRLLSAVDLRVLTLHVGEDGKPTYTEFPKDADVVYPYASPEKAPYQVNMLFGASEILSGEARAIAVETGANAYLSEIPNFVIPAEGKAKQTEQDAAFALRPYLSLYSWLMIAALLILTVIGIFSSPEHYGTMDLFLPLSILAGAASPALIRLCFRMFQMHGSASLMQSQPPQNRAVLKSDRAQERMNQMTDILVIGHSASSDGISHFLRAAVARGEIKPDPQAPQPLLQPLCEAFCLLKFADEAMRATLAGEGEDDGYFLSELIEASLLDVSALRIRLLNACSITVNDKIRAIDVEMRESRFKLLFSEDLRLLKRCILCEDGNRLSAITSEQRKLLEDFCLRASCEVARTVTVVRQYPDGTLALVGIVAMQEKFQKILPSVVEELKQCGIRTTFFLTGSVAAERAYADEAQLPGTVLQKNEEHPHLTSTLLEDARVCIGFSKQELTFLLKAWKQEGRRVAVLGGSPEERTVLKNASLVFACDPTEYHHKNAEEAALEHLPSDGCENSARCSQVIRRRADVLIHRASRHAGGLSAILQSVSDSRACRYRMQLLLAFLLSSQLFRFVTVACSVCFGIGVWNGGQMIVASFLTELFAAFWILHLPLSQSHLRAVPPLDGNQVVLLLTDRKTLLSIFLLPFLGTLYPAIFMWCGVITSVHASAYLFVSYELVQLVLLYTIAFKKCERLSYLQILLPILSVALPIGIVVLISCFFSPMGMLTGLGAWHPVTVCSLPLLPAGLILIKFFSSFLNRTAK